MAERTLMKGNEALAEGAIRAGCRFFAGYPITPQNEVPEYMSWRIPQEGGFFIQAESEVAAINMLFGAAATGARTMTSSSSPGISLKQEGISYCAGADLPIFYANVVRGGPGLGNIAPAQGDYFQSTRGGGHGDYRVFVMAPNSVSEMANFPKVCYDIAFKYRVPSMILADGILGQMMEPVEFNFDPIDPNTFGPFDWTIGGDASGRERRVVKSYDLKPGMLEKLNFERQAKFDKIEKEEAQWDGEGLDDCDLLIASYGSCSRISKSAAKLAREDGLKVGLLRPITLYPFPNAKFKEMGEKVKDILVVEMSLGQFVEDVKLATMGSAKIHFHGRPAGGIPSAEEVYEIVKQIMGK
ncbi:MAG: 3-methyl-2-oxobutanoate dehydrogenase subunit VorB [candidate division Zixibacteria bacterium]|nr:3-methyl-2-oxobutanoate dehydrogenase subunit VorB [candidate division Zixibacteria bacterium]